MIHETSFLASLAAVLGVAAITSLICQKLKLPTILGYLLAGLLVGPYTSPFALADPKTVSELSELGVILLMYSVGLELSLRDLARIGWRGVAVALTGFGVTFWIGSIVLSLLGYNGVLAVFMVASLCISSTMLIVTTFSAQKISGKLREGVLGVVVIEDIIAVLMLALLTTLATTRSFDPVDLLRTAGRLLGFLLALGVVGALIVPRLLRSVAKSGEAESLLIASVGVCFVFALAALTMGYSVALGAFLAGTLSAESGERHRIADLLKPLVSLFGAVFFVAAGMSIEPRLLLQHWHLIAFLLPVVLIGKLVGITLGFFATGNDVRTSIQGGLSMAQTGEFAFIVAALGTLLGPEGAILMPVAAGVAGLSMLIAPYAIRFAPRIASVVDANLPRRLQTFVALYGSWIESIGSRRSEDVPRARRLVRLIVLDVVLLLMITVCANLLDDDLRRLLRTYTDLAARTARWTVYAGFVLLEVPVAIGLWRQIGYLGKELAWRALPKAPDGDVDFAQAPRRVLVLSLQLGLLLVVSLPLLAITQSLMPRYSGLIILGLLLPASAIAFWRSTGELQAHARAGASAVLEALSHLSGAAPTQADAESEPDAQADLDAMETVLPGLGHFAGAELKASSSAVGASLAKLNLRGLTGATVLAIRRADGGVLTPVGREVLQAGDVLILAGSEDALLSARELLHR